MSKWAMGVAMVKGISPVLYRTIDDIRPGEQQLVKLKMGNTLKELAVQSSGFKVGEDLFK